MRENSGKGDSHTGLLDPTIKEQEAKKGRSGQAMLKRPGKGGGKRQPPEGGPAGKS